MYSTQEYVELSDCGFEGARYALPRCEFSPSLIDWDRTSRLKSVASFVLSLKLEDRTKILDVGGGDGALSFFLPQHQIIVVDPFTTGGSGLHLPFPDGYFDVVVSIDAIEHIQPQNRLKFISECLRVCLKTFILHFPEFQSMPAQKLVHKLFPNNQFIREHVEYILPSELEMINTIQNCQPKITIISHHHMPVLAWLLWFCSFHGGLDKDSDVTTFLMNLDSSFTSDNSCLYNVLVCTICK